MRYEHVLSCGSIFFGISGNLTPGVKILDPRPPTENAKSYHFSEQLKPFWPGVHNINQ